MEANVSKLNNETFNKNDNMLQSHKISNLTLEQELQAVPTKQHLPRGTSAFNK